ncbi:uncharacterized protein UDID_17069 [Ustilago sp. UG-2017a]|nr:uncharacterized protein UDID_17069 [Ustilago sp. UG-2017a]
MFDRIDFARSPIGSIFPDLRSDTLCSARSSSGSCWIVLFSTPLSWDRMNAQEELESYEETMRSDRGLGKERVLAELSEISRIEGSMTELVGIGRSKVLLQSLLGSVVPHSYDRSHGNWFEDTSITDLAAGGQQTRKDLPSDEVGALCDNERGVRRWAPSSGAR